MKTQMQFIGYILVSTDKAVLFHDHFWESPDWMPKSQITVASDPNTQETVIRASDWICGRKGLEEFHYRPQEGQPDV